MHVPRSWVGSGLLILRARIRFALCSPLAGGGNAWCKPLHPPHWRRGRRAYMVKEIGAVWRSGNFGVSETIRSLRNGILVVPTAAASGLRVPADAPCRAEAPSPGKRTQLSNF